MDAIGPYDVRHERGLRNRVVLAPLGWRQVFRWWSEGDGD